VDTREDVRERGKTRKLPLAESKPQLLSRPACSQSLHPLSYRTQGVALPRNCSERKLLKCRVINTLLYKLSCLQDGGAACSVSVAARISTFRDSLQLLREPRICRTYKLTECSLLYYQQPLSKHWPVKHITRLKIFIKTALILS
jgi:hypothetical protein